MAHSASATSTPWLDPRAQARLRRRLEAAIRRRRSSGSRVLVSVTSALGPATDPSAVVAASRRPDEPWFCFEQPDRDGAALAALGSVLAIETGGEDRFRQMAKRWRAIARDALADDADGPGGAGLVALGGFAFAPTGGASPVWAGFAPGSLIVPEVSLARRGGASWITVNVALSGEDTADTAAERVETRLAELRRARLPLLDPVPVGTYDVVSPMPPAHYEEAVARAVQRITAGDFEKVVLAREVEVHAPVAHDPAAVFGLLREAFPSSFTYAVGRGDATFIGATPELLIRREGQRASTVALAGSTRRSADPAVDDHLGEQLLRSDKDRQENAIVARRIARTLTPFSVWVTAAPEPVVVKVANIQHLAAPIRAQLASPLDAVELVGHLHPTPAVGAEPRAALEVIPALEGFDRGWYAGPVGWTDASGDGEFCVALRCALVRGNVGRCYAGCGIVRDSDPAAELAETEVKLQVMLPALAG
ncbi:MAG TPA: isochorismate synthase [Solirubrobacteraceae bacterium]|nr:isochorismate synthase [Solirubrobacteraceae bacterium]